MGKRLAGLRFVEPRSKPEPPDPGEIEARARDAGFKNEEEHQCWRRANGITGVVIRRSK